MTANPNRPNVVPERTFEDLLADPDEQFDARSELLASIVAYASAPPLAASGQRPADPSWKVET